MELPIAKFQLPIFYRRGIPARRSKSSDFQLAIGNGQWAIGNGQWAIPRGL
jgi:hypothetical protein